MATKKNNRPKKYKKKQKFKLKAESIKSLFALVCFALAGLTLLAFIGQAAGAGNTLQAWFNHLLGWASFMIPVLLLSLGLFLSYVNWSIAKPNVLLGLTIISTGLAAILHPISSLFSPFPALQRAELGIGGGTIGYTIFDGLAQFVNPFGAWFLLLLWIIAGFLVLLNTSLSFFFEASESAAKAGKDALTKKKSKEEDAPAFSSPAFSITESKNSDSRAVSSDHQATAPAINATQVISNTAGENVVWEYPSLAMLSNVNSKGDPGDMKATAAILERTLESFGIQAKVVHAHPGPTVTQYSLQLASGTKTAKITNLANDLALAVAARSGAVRIEAPIPGQSLVGIEIPNQKSAVVGMRSILESKEAEELKTKSKLLLPLGLSVSGNPMVADLTRMPHLLVAGATGSGKSVAINSFISSLLFLNSPSELKLILVDPKFVELTGYNGIPHLLTPVITEGDKVVSALKWATKEMDLRYQKLATVGARNIEGYNEMSGFQALPYIVIIIDELSDLMMTAPKEVEDAIVRIGQKARAVGIHLILATQRPSSDIITGLIKSNIPARIAFNVTSNTDSRVIMDHSGAEKLLGRGDMLFLAPDAAKPVRIQGNWIKDEEIKKLIDHVKAQGVDAEYSEEVLNTATASGGGSYVGGGGGGEDRDPLFADAVRVVCASDKAASSLLQRRIKIGYARAARILDDLEQAGVVGPADGNKPREVLIRDAEGFLASQD